MSRPRQHEPSREQPLTEDVAQPTHAERVRTLLAAEATGTLSTLREGHPYGSLVTFAVEDGSPIFLLSEMAAHTQNLRLDGRVSLLVAERVVTDPLAHSRVTLVGECSVLEDSSAAREVFLTRHEGANVYVDFRDFHFWRLAISSLRYIGGFGRMSWVDAEAFAQAEPDPLAPDAEGILAHMNEDHADANLAYARAFTRATTATSARMTAVDRYGFDLMVDWSKGDTTRTQPARVAFDEQVASPDQARAALVRLVKRARQELNAT